jgi:TolB-like protein
MWFKPWEVREEPASIERMAFPLPDKPSIAVLPFDNLTDDLDQDYFVDGLTEDIITELSRFSELFVISGRSTFTYKNKAVKVGQVAEELGVRYVLEGSVRRTDTELLVTAQLIDATSGVHIWAERYEQPVTEFHTVQAYVLDKIVSTVADRVENVGLRIANRKQTGNLGAYEHVLQGYALAMRWNKESNEKARTHFEKAIELDAQYARAYSGLAFTHNIDFGRGWSKDVDVSFPAAKAVAWGYQKVYWYNSGVHGWQEAGYPVEQGE